VPIEITHGFSKDGRPDLKQFVISLVMSDSLPVFIQALSGNTSDKSHFREIVKEYGKSLQEIWGEDKIGVWDSAGYTEQTIKEKWKQDSCDGDDNGACTYDLWYSGEEVARSAGEGEWVDSRSKEQVLSLLGREYERMYCPSYG
jgi:hypothetical protein